MKPHICTIFSACQSASAARFVSQRVKRITPIHQSRFTDTFKCKALCYLYLQEICICVSVTFEQIARENHLLFLLTFWSWLKEMFFLPNRAIVSGIGLSIVLLLSLDAYDAGAAKCTDADKEVTGHTIHQCKMQQISVRPRADLLFKSCDYPAKRIVSTASEQTRTA